MQNFGDPKNGNQMKHIFEICTKFEINSNIID